MKPELRNPTLHEQKVLGSVHSKGGVPGLDWDCIQIQVVSSANIHGD